MKIARESKAIESMIGIYCHDRHGKKDELCPECQKFLDYARERLEKCYFHENKPTCAKCPVHCYRPAMREKIRQVMRYSALRMFHHHPILAISHLIDGLKKNRSGINRKAGIS